MSNIEIKLAHPVTMGDEEITTLKLRHPKARDLRACSAPDKPFAMMLDLAVALSDLPRSVIDNLELVDAMAVVEKVSGFLPQLPPTGTTSSEM